MNEKHSSYYDRTEIARKVSAGEHRALIGGLWDEIGELQLKGPNRELKDAKI